MITELNSIVLAASLPQFSHVFPMQARKRPRLIKSLLWVDSYTMCGFRRYVK
jgi:hypothetical protein